MKLRKILKYFVPFGLIMILRIHREKKRTRDAINRYKQLRRSKILESNISISKAKKNQRAFLLATGPSINELDLSLLKGEDVYSVSNAFLHKDINNINPKLHFFAPYHKPLIKTNYIAWLKEADTKLPATTNIVLSWEDKAIIDSNSLFKNRIVFYFQFDNRISYDQPLSFDKPFPSFQTGPQMIFPILFCLDYKQVFLIGCDQNVLKNFKNDRENFYPKEMDKRTNATDKNSWPNIITELKSQLKIFEIYQQISKYAQRNKTQVINTSKDSWIDYFPYTDYPSLFQNHNHNFQ
jgi:hypothetical protein